MNKTNLSVMFLAFFLASCAANPTLRDGDSAYLDTQAKAAAEAAEQGDLAHALALWRTILTLAPKDAQALQATHALQVRIVPETAEAIARGKSAYDRGRTRDGDRWMLRALALTPGEPQALAALQHSVSEASHDRQSEKSASEYEVAAREPAPAQTLAPEDPVEHMRQRFAAGDFQDVLDQAETYTGDDTAAIAQLRRSSHLALAKLAAANKRPELELVHLDSALARTAASPGDDALMVQRAKLARGLSEEYYKNGLALMKSDLPGALDALEKSVSFDPTNIAAQEKLDQARTLQKNLQHIRSN